MILENSTINVRFLEESVFYKSLQYQVNYLHLKCLIQKTNLWYACRQKLQALFELKCPHVVFKDKDDLILESNKYLRFSKSTHGKAKGKPYHWKKICSELGKTILRYFFSLFQREQFVLISTVRKPYYIESFTK